MAQIVIRGLDESVKRRLQARASSHGVSMESEARAILTRGVREQGSRLARIRAVVASYGGADLDIPARTDMPRAPEW